MSRPLGALLASLLVVTAGFASVGSASIGVHTGPTDGLGSPVPVVGDHDASGGDHGQGDGSSGSASGKNGDKAGDEQPSNPSDGGGNGSDSGSGDDSNRSGPGGGSDSGSNEASNATGPGEQGTGPGDDPPTDERNAAGNPKQTGTERGNQADTPGGPPGDCGPSEPPSTPAAPATNRGPTAACGDGGLATISFAGVDENATALELRVTAWRLLDDATASEPNETGLPPARGSRLRATLNGSFGHFVGFDRVNDRAVLDDDRHVAAAAGHRAPNATARLIVADERLARTAVADAERVAERLRDRNASFDEATVERELANARRALNHAERDREHSLNPVAAVAHYRRAWEHAQHALDVMDAATAPAVTFANRTDPPHDGPLNYTVQGAVFDVRPWRIGNVTVSVNGVDRTVPVFARNATPGVAAGFAVRVPIEAPVNRIGVTATDSGEVVSNRSDPYEPNEGTATLRLDADGLPDRYEVNRTTTDPLDPDSDAAATGANESGDGIGDGAADLDRDRLTDVQEFRLGTDPLDADTDGDGLTDWFELRFAETDPLTVDTDGDGSADGEEDPDGDGLTNAVEEAFGSDPLRADGDGDGLVDPAERDLGTDPLDADSDDDGLLDGREPEAPFHTDPLDPDTDDDGVLDGDETYTAAVENASVGASVAVTGAGDAAAGIDVERDTEAFLNTSGTRAAGVSSRVRVASAREFESLRVRLAYDQSAVSDGADVAVYRWNRTVQTFVRLESQKDVANDTVSANATQAGTFVAFDVGAWEALFAEPLPARQSVDVDEFSSENVTCEGSGECGVEDGTLSVGSAFLEISPSVLAQLIGTLNDQIDTGGGGDDGGGSDDADGDGVSNPDDDCPFEAGDGPDGCPSESDDPSTPTPPPDRDGDGVADPDDECPDDSETTTEPCFVGTAVGATVTLPAGAEEIRIEVDVRADVRESAGYVEVWLDHDGGREVLYAQHGTGGTAGSDFVTFSQDITHLAGETVTLSLEKGGDASGDVDAMRVFLDSDGDGLTDNEEREGFRMGNGETVSTNVHEADTDDDGLDDSEEVLKRTSWSGNAYFIVQSNPTTRHSDADGLDDERELKLGWEVPVLEKPITVDGTTYTGPYRYAPNEQAATTERFFADPLRADTDGDGLTDREEKAETKTDPRKSITYSITREHQAEIVDPVIETSDDDQIEALGLSAVLGDSERLTDRSDAFDIVTADDGSLVFTALDRTERTDTWLSNERELAIGTDPWDPDSDDDGLTDG